MERGTNYKKLFDSYVDVDTMRDITMMTQKGLVLGREDFIQKVEQLSKVRVRELKSGRPRKQEI